MTTHVTNLPDLASRALGGNVSAANDELFAQRENLIRAAAPVFDPHEFGHKGKVYDGWETRRRRDQGHDYAIVRLGAAGIVHGVVVDTSYFKGNYPPHISVEATSIEGYPRVEEIVKADWQTIVAKSPAEGDTANVYAVTDRHRWTHVRLSIYPDGGVARLRVHGEVVPDPRFLQGTIDLLAAENGGRLVDCSDAFYASPANIILPGRATNMGEGWENARRRGPGNDYALFALAATGRPRYAEVDITVETCPHYLSFTSEEIPAGATQFKCCPPIREADNRELLWQGLSDGVIDCVVTDHSPCTTDLKRFDIGDFSIAWGGMASLQVSLSAVWSEAKRRGHSLNDVVKWMAENPAKQAGLSTKGHVGLGYAADLVVFAPDATFIVDSTKLHHKNAVSAYDRRALTGVVRETWLAGRRIDLDEAPRGQLLRRMA